MSNPLEVFINTALGQMGSGIDWVIAQGVGCSKGAAWCAFFVSACAKVAGVGNVIIPIDGGSGNIAARGVANGWGIFLDGPRNRCNATPTVGDIMNIHYGRTPTIVVGKYTCTHVAIVTSVNGDQFTTTGGNETHGGKKCVGQNTFSISDSRIVGFYRPNWQSVGGSYSGMGASYGLDATSGSPGIYIPSKSREDAIGREIGYFNLSDYSKSVSKSDCRLSVVDYISPLASMINKLYGAKKILSLDGLPEVEQQIIKYFWDKGETAAFGVGIVACLKVDRGGGDLKNDCIYGGWDLPSLYKNALTKFNSGWKNSLTAQLDFLWAEFRTTERSTYRLLSQVEESESGAMNSAEIFSNNYGLFSLLKKLNLFNFVEVSIKREMAKELWSSVSIVEMNTTVGGADSNSVGTNGQNIGGGIGFSPIRGELRICTDGCPTNRFHDPDWQATTARTIGGRYCDAEYVNYIVVPHDSSTKYLYDLGVVIDNSTGKFVPCIAIEVGPGPGSRDYGWGEVSIGVIMNLGLYKTVKAGPSGNFTVMIFPGSGSAEGTKNWSYEGLSSHIYSVVTSKYYKPGGSSSNYDPTTSEFTKG